MRKPPSPRKWAESLSRRKRWGVRTGLLLVTLFGLVPVLCQTRTGLLYSGTDFLQRWTPSGRATAYQQGHTGQRLAPGPVWHRGAIRDRGPAAPHVEVEVQHGNTVAASQQGDSPEVFLASGDTDRLSHVSLRQNLQYPSIQDLTVRQCRLEDDLFVTVQRDAQIELTASLLGQRRAQKTVWWSQIHVLNSQMKVSVMQQREISLLLNTVCQLSHAAVSLDHLDSTSANMKQKLKSDFR